MPDHMYGDEEKPLSSDSEEEEEEKEKEEDLFTLNLVKVKSHKFGSLLKSNNIVQRAYAK